MAASKTSPPASSAEPVSSSDMLASMTDDERSTWEATGDLPSAEPTPDKTSSSADSTPATPVDRAPSTEGSKTADSDPATSSTTEDQSSPDPEAAYKAKTAKRIEELLEDRRELQRRLDALETTRRSDASPDSSPSVSSLAQVVQRPDTTQPVLSDAQFYERYPEATVGDYTRYAARYELTLDRQQQDAVAAVQSRIGGYQDQIKAAVAKTPDFLTSLHPRVLGLEPVDMARARGVPVTAEHVLAQAVFESTAAVALLQTLSAHPEQIDQIAQLPSEGAVYRAIGRLEAAATAPESASSSSTVPSIPEPSHAPAPSTTLGTKTRVSSLAESDQALADGDFARYEALRNREEAKAFA